MSDVKLDWAEATVKDGKLRVPLAGEVPKGWKTHFETTVKLLGRARGEWGTVELKKKVIQVAKTDDGSADDLRFYLEGVVDQANSAAEADREKKKKKAASGSGSDGKPEGPDAELTERFRAFGEKSADAEPDAGAVSDS